MCRGGWRELGWCRGRRGSVVHEISLACDEGREQEGRRDVLDGSGLRDSGSNPTIRQCCRSSSACHHQAAETGRVKRKGRASLSRWAGGKRRARSCRREGGTKRAASPSVSAEALPVRQNGKDEERAKVQTHQTRAGSERRSRKQCRDSQDGLRDARDSSVQPSGVYERAHAPR